MMLNFAPAACFACLAYLPLLSGTLSKSDKPKQSKPAAVPQPSAPSSVDASAGLTAEEILRTHERLNFGEARHFPNAVLAYVTPWNNHGYDIAKWMSHKLTHVAPVWFQVVPSGEADDHDGPNCQVAGTHDLDRGWLADVRRNNSAVRIVPRFLVERWTPADLLRLLSDEMAQQRCAGVVLDFIQRNHFDGAVVEVWLQVMSMSQGRAVADLTHFVINWAELFAQRGVQFILPVPAPLDANQLSGVFLPDHFAQLAPHVSHINVMAYDFPSRKIGPVAPIDWVRKNIEVLASAAPAHLNKMLMGLNFYGQEQLSKTSSHQPIIGRRFIEILRNEKPKLSWHKSAAEHFVQKGDLVAYFPSLASVEARLKLAVQLNVGIAIWEVGQGLDYFYNLL